jgi:hypothetical protein
MKNNLFFWFYQIKNKIKDYLGIINKNKYKMISYEDSKNEGIIIKIYLYPLTNYS